jgi:peptidoglycan lytic transglycosylase D
MSLEALLRAYLQAAAALAAGGLVGWAGWRLASARGRTPDAAAWVRLGRGLLVLACAAPLLGPLLPARPSLDLRPLRALEGWAPEARTSAARRPPSAVPAEAAPAEHRDWLAALAWCALALMAAQTVRTGVEVARLARHLRGLPVLRRAGRVRLLVCDDASVPYAAAWGASAFIVVPQGLLVDWPRLRRVVAHEAQHLRARDVAWAWLLQALRCAYAWHPLLRAWLRSLDEAQEMACDAAARPRADRAAYAEALVWAVAQARRPAVPVLAAGSPGRLLERRLAVLMSDRTRNRNGAWALALVALVAIGLSAMATAGDQPSARAEALLAARASGSFPVPASEAVKAELRRWMDTAEGQRRARLALASMAPYEPMVTGTLAEAGLPAELRAIPIVESGYRNYDSAAVSPGARGAGIWMFIPETARRFGLVVTTARDDRLDPAAETAAAAAYLKKLHQRFGDWGLALAAYAEGESRVEGAIREGGSRDVWQLIEDKRLGPYPAAVMAAVLLIDDPTLVR